MWTNWCAFPDLGELESARVPNILGLKQMPAPLCCGVLLRAFELETCFFDHHPWEGHAIDECQAWAKPALTWVPSPSPLPRPRPSAL